MNLSRVLAAVLLLICSHAAEPQASPPPLASFQLVILTKGPNAATAGTEKGQRVIKQHIEHLYSLHQQGPLKAAGPFTDGGEIQGILLLAAATPEEAIRLESADPAVQAGIFSMAALPFLSAPDRFGAWAEFGKFERVYFGFLVSGPNRGQDAETAKRLQGEHLAYMGDQAKEGKLVVAGPFAVESPRRGIVVYRAANEIEAKQRAEADPMVKAGRLAVELHPWQVPVGAIIAGAAAPR